MLKNEDKMRNAAQTLLENNEAEDYITTLLSFLLNANLVDIDHSQMSVSLIINKSGSA